MTDSQPKWTLKDAFLSDLSTAIQRGSFASVGWIAFSYALAATPPTIPCFSTFGDLIGPVPPDEVPITLVIQIVLTLVAAFSTWSFWRTRSLGFCSGAWPAISRGASALTEDDYVEADMLIRRLIQRSEGVEAREILDALLSEVRPLTGRELLLALRAKFVN